MTVSDFCRYTLGFFAGTAVIAGCRGGGVLRQAQDDMPLSRPPFGVKAMRTGSTGTYRVLYSFQRTPDGQYPTVGLIDVKGILYGTTGAGGVECVEHGGCGTVFSLTTSGSEAVLYKFHRPSGDFPLALINVNGTLYGMAGYGGGGCKKIAGCGTVFALTRSGKRTVLHEFNKRTGDGATPSSSLLNVDGTLYGTTDNGGSNDNGTVFAITTSGAETVLYKFAGGPEDGSTPSGALINVNGTLYGATSDGGAGGEGTVFSITPSGSESVLYSFQGKPDDGAFPMGALVDVNGTLYGTTGSGGAYGPGTLFAITTSGAVTVLHSFGDGTGDGKMPLYERLIDVNGTLYGTTWIGGSGTYGTVFSFSL